MSKVIKWKYVNFFQSRREKLINLLFSEIIFLKSSVKKSKISNKQQIIKNALDKFNYILNLLKNFEKDLTDKEFNKFIKLIYEILKEIVINIK